MNFNAARPAINSVLPPPPSSAAQQRIQPPSTPLPRQLSSGGAMDEFVANELLVDRYQITRKIGQGGMGQVFAAVDQRLSREVVVKVSHSAGDGPSAEDRARFEREALKMASLNHPNIVTIYDCGDHQSEQFLVMELIKGDTLKSFVTHPDTMSVDLFKDIVTQLLRGVQEAHDHDVIHRDLKPSNLMWDAERKILKILDFGLARGVEGDTVTGTGHVHGSIQYMAPEQIRGESQGPATDIYAVGILCFQLISKTLPFRGDNTVELMFQKLQKDPYDLLEQDKTPSWVTPALAKVIRSCLNLKQSDRPNTADECLQQILATLPQVNGFEIQERTNPFHFEESSINRLSSAPDSTKVHWSSLIRSHFILFLLTAIFGAVAFMFGTSLFVEEGLNPTQSLVQQPASVYFTSIDHLSNSESQVRLEVNGQEQGVTPLQLELVEGRYEVSLIQGEWRFSKTYDLKAGKSYWYALPAPPQLQFKLPTPKALSPETRLEDSNPATLKSLKIGKDKTESRAKRRSKRQKRSMSNARSRTKVKSKSKTSTRSAKVERRKPKSQIRKTSQRTRTTAEPVKMKPAKKNRPSKKKHAIDVPLLELE